MTNKSQDKIDNIRRERGGGAIGALQIQNIKQMSDDSGLRDHTADSV